jgi:hypothetical protein
MNFEQTLRDNRLFIMFSMALMTMAKSNRMLQEGGASPEAIKQISAGIDLIATQLDKAALKMETEIEALKNVEELSKKLGIPRTDKPGFSDKEN